MCMSLFKIFSSVCSVVKNVVHLFFRTSSKSRITCNNSELFPLLFGLLTDKLPPVFMNLLPMITQPQLEQEQLS